MSNSTTSSESAKSALGRLDFYPAIEPFATHRLRVSELHEIYIEQVGNPKGRPVVFLHGGPGGGLDPDHRRFFDPQRYHVVLIDQRGCGQSTPFAELKENTTWDLVSDIEKVRAHLGIQKWHVFGGSWGSTLALAYASRHPEMISALILRGIFMCRKSEIDWFYQAGAHEVFPDNWEPYRDLIPFEERNDFVAAYYRRLTSPSADVRLRAAQVWSQWEAGSSYMIPKADVVAGYGDPEKALPFARIECHYFTNRAFFPTDNYLLEQVPKFRHIPGVIVQGRYDMVCPARSAWELHRAWPEAEFLMIPDAGHAASEPGIRSALIHATNRLA